MKKTLYATTALVAAGFAVGPVGAAKAADPIKLGISGYMNQAIGFADNDNIEPSDAISGGADDKASFDINVNSEVWFKGSTKLDNGITVGLDFQLEGENSGDQIDETYMWVEGGFGKLILGDENNAPYLTTLGFVPDVGFGFSSGDIILDWTRFNVGAGMGLFSPNINNENDATTITYLTPRVVGFRAGVSYTPINTQDANTPIQGTSQTNGRSVSLDYKTEINDFGIGVQVGYEAWMAPDGGAQNAVDDASVRTWGAGGQLNYAGFQLNAQWKHTYSGMSTATTSLKGHNWVVGGKYAQGPWAISLAYMDSSREGLATQVGQDDLDYIQFSGSWSLGPGVTLATSIWHADIDTEFPNQTSGETDNSVFGVIAGFKLGF